MDMKNECNMVLGEHCTKEISCGELSFDEAVDLMKKSNSVNSSDVGGLGACCLLASSTKAHLSPVHYKMNKEDQWHQLTINTS